MCGHLRAASESHAFATFRRGVASRHPFRSPCAGVQWRRLQLAWRRAGMLVVERVAFAVASTALAALAVVLVALVVETAVPEPRVGPEGRVPAWVEQEREAPTASPSAAAG
jgi:hypothetical protein